MQEERGIWERDEGAGRGDVAALVRQFAPLVRGLARRYEGRGAEREDLEQEGYVALIQIARRFGAREMALRLKRHLPGYVRDAAARMWRSPRLVPLMEPDGEGDGQSLAELLPDGHAEQDVDLLELMDALERSLPPEEMTLALALAEGRTQEEIALESGRSRASVARSIAAMRGRLKRGGKNASAPRVRAAR